MFDIMKITIGDVNIIAKKHIGERILSNLEDSIISQYGAVSTESPRNIKVSLVNQCDLTDEESDAYTRHYTAD